MPLNPWQISMFRHNGFIRIPGRIPEDEVAALKAAAWDNIKNHREPLSRGAGDEVVRVSNVLEREQIFWDTATHLRVLGPMVDLMGPNIEMMRQKHNHVQLVTKAANAGAYYHRDCLTWTKGSISAIYYLEESTVAKGCTKVIPGSHNLPWIDATGGVHKDQDTADAWGVMDQEVLVEMPVGGILLTDNLLLHSIGINTTDMTRMSMTIGYSTPDEFATLDDPNRWLIHGERRKEGNRYERLRTVQT